jgi:hypothetical protein
MTSEEYKDYIRALEASIAATESRIAVLREEKATHVRTLNMAKANLKCLEAQEKVK